MLTKPREGDVRYHYGHQAWVRRVGSAWVVEACGHPASMRPGCCYSGDHAGERVPDSEEIR